MRKYFEIFEGYENYADVIEDEQNAIYDDDGVRCYTLADLGREFIFSETINFNKFCRTWNNSLYVHPIQEEKDCFAFLEECAVFASGFDVPGFVSLRNDATGDIAMLADTVYTNAYNGVSHYNYFYILFNARPSDIHCSDNIATFGYDKYGIVYAPNNIIVWNLDRYSEWRQNKYRLWGIKQETGTQLSLTDDVMLAIDGDRVQYAYEQ